MAFSVSESLAKSIFAGEPYQPPIFNNAMIEQTTSIVRNSRNEAQAKISTKSSGK